MTTKDIVRALLRGLWLAVRALWSLAVAIGAIAGLDAELPHLLDDMGKAGIWDRAAGVWGFLTGVWTGYWDDICLSVVIILGSLYILVDKSRQKSKQEFDKIRKKSKSKGKGRKK